MDVKCSTTSLGVETHRMNFNMCIYQKNSKYFTKRFMYLKGKVWFTLKMITTPRTVSGQSQDPRTPPKAATCTEDSHVHGLSSAAFPHALESS